jgi:hypothetical protein
MWSPSSSKLVDGEGNEVSERLYITNRRVGHCEICEFTQWSDERAIGILRLIVFQENIDLWSGGEIAAGCAEGPNFVLRTTRS